MLIEVLKRHTEAAKAQGDVLENFVSKWLKTQGYSVHQNVRVTAAELDLLCKKEVSGEQIYVECKAYNDTPISALQLKSFLGTLDSEQFQEGWFVSTGEFGRDAKGFVEKWESREDRVRMHIYTPDRLIECLKSAAVVSPEPNEIVGGILKDGESIGDWIMVLSEFGQHWATTILRHGMPVCYVLCDASRSSSGIVKDKDFLSRFSEFDFSLAKKGIPYYSDYIWRRDLADAEIKKSPVVEVEFGEDWSDYRPSRPEHFVGRKRNLKDVFKFIAAVKKDSVSSRVFAIKGDSGIGKSSFVAKIRDEARLRQKPSNVYVYAVDVRAANDLSYIGQSLIRCLLSAQQKGYGSGVRIELTNSRNPLASDSVVEFLAACRIKNQVIVLIFDQFEELYSKAGLCDLFDEAKKLFFSTISARANFILGFAWKTDCTIPQDHPAYYMWQSLSDHRFEITLRPFAKDDAVASIALFEKEIKQTLRPDLKGYLLENCQGLPWLLKKLCVHLKDTICQGCSQVHMEKVGLDIASLFEQDLSSLTSEALQCLRLIAANAPMDWFDAVSSTSPDTINYLQGLRLVLRKGNKLNLYWDIFKEYVLHKTVPEVPFCYFPQSASLEALIKVANTLDSFKEIPIDVVGNETEFSKKTVANIVTDLVRVGLITAENGRVKVEGGVDCKDRCAVLRYLRSAFRRHRVVSMLRASCSASPISMSQFHDIIEQCMSAPVCDRATIRAYANRMKTWLTCLGYLRMESVDIRFEDRGDILSDIPLRRSRLRGNVFIGDASPSLASQVLKTIIDSAPYKANAESKPGWRNAISLLMRLNLIEQIEHGVFVPVLSEAGDIDALESLYARSEREPSIQRTIDIITKDPTASALRIGKEISKSAKRPWVDASAIRIGGALRIWARWIICSREARMILSPPGRKNKRDDFQLSFEFDC